MFTDKTGDIRWGKIITSIVILLFIIITFFNSFAIIPTGYTGVSTTFGQIDNAVVGNGWIWKVPFVQSIQRVNNKQQELATNTNTRIWGEASDQTVVYMEGVTVTYQLNPEFSAWAYANVSDYKQNVLPESLFLSAMKAALRAFPPSEVTSRTNIEPVAAEGLQAALNELYDGRQVITINNVAINNIDFEDSYNEAIASRQNTQILLEQQETENQIANDAARAAAERVDIAADAEAAAILKIAEAQAKANRLLEDSITNGIISFETIQKWNGELPQVTGGVTPFVNFDLKDTVSTPAPVYRGDGE